MERESKVCARCGRVMHARKKWDRNWDEVKYCSERCRRARPDDLEQKILTLLHERGASKTICPSEVLPADDKQDAQKMETVRSAARRLVAKGLIEIHQKGRAVDPSTAKGPIRLKLKPGGIE